jgi:glycosyltransferase involved in cell wall biosynthesis/GT2 family glycosyltransferase
MEKQLSLVNGIDKIIYGTSEFHRLLSKDYNIGLNAENLTIVVLSCNRYEATIKMLKTIEDICLSFKGKILIADNGSTEETIKKLKEKINQTKLNCKLLEFGENFGVAKGRNKAVEFVDTDWFMSLDNDIYFTKDLFKNIQSTISKLGCKFLNLGLLNSDKKTLFSLGGHIYLTPMNDGIHIGCGSTYKQDNLNNISSFEDTLATFLFGGCSVLNKAAFINCGKFDENMFVGFEDIDFSIKVFNEGYKIGCCGELGLVHDHVKSESKDDLEYEKKRFCNKNLFESAKYFEKKNNFKIWNSETEKWLMEREKELGISNNDLKEKTVEKEKIALVVDVKNWAFDNIAKNIIKNIGYKYDFKIVYLSELDDNIIHLIYSCMDCKIIHFFWRGHINFINGAFSKQYLSYYGTGYENFKNEIINKLYITTSVYDHKYLEDNFELTKNIMDFVKSYTVSSTKLMDIYSKLDIKKPYMEITDGVDLDIFHPINLERFDNVKNRKLIIGWVGNSEWGNDNLDHKGVNTILKPAIEELIKEGYNIEPYFADKKDKHIPLNKMCEYYSSIDVYICNSINEGTPNPVLESMACGVPVISTDVGIVKEVLGQKQQDYIMKDRSIESLKEKIKLLIQNIDEIKELSDENLSRIKDWTWNVKCRDFEKFFDYNIKLANEQNRGV